MNPAPRDAPLRPRPMAIEPLAIRAYSVTTALGAGLAAQRRALAARASGLKKNDFTPTPLDCWIGRVAGLETMRLPEPWARWDCRNNRLAWMALNQDGLLPALAEAAARHRADRIAVVVGTSTSSIGATEAAYAHLDEQGRFAPEFMRPIVHMPHSLGSFVQQATGLRGPCVTVATACSSSAKVFAQASRLIAAGFADAALVGGVDTLCGSVLFGFNALQLVSRAPCRPFDLQRDGLSLGEAGGFALLERASAEQADGLQLRGYGESSDAHHMSAPHPQGLGARLAMQDALARAGIEAADVGHLNLHGTATPANDRIEAAAVGALFAPTLHASSTKGWTGHTLGAAGMVESAFALLALDHDLLPGTLNSRVPDPECGFRIGFENVSRRIEFAMNNSFGFGGNNCSLVFGRTGAALP